MKTYQSQMMHSSYGSVPLAYSTSTHNNSFTPIQPYHQSIEMKDRSFIDRSMESSSFTFNKFTLNNNASFKSGIQETTALRFGDNLTAIKLPQINQQVYSSQLSPRFSTVQIQPPMQYRYSQRKQIIQQQFIPPSQEILNNQHNYSFVNNHSSLKSFQQKRFQSRELAAHSPISHYKQSPAIYKYNNIRTQTPEHSSHKPKTHITNINNHRPESGTFSRFSTFGQQQQNLLSGNFSSSKFNYKKIGQHIYANKNEQNSYLSKNSQSQQQYQPSFLDKANPTATSLAKFQQYPDSIMNSSNLQSKLLNRELTQLRSDQILRMPTISDTQNGVQQFRLKFDSHFKEQKDFTGFCGYKGKRIIFDSKEDTPLC